jgi:hypothetical protein
MVVVLEHGEAGHSALKPVTNAAGGSSPSGGNLDVLP